MFLIISKYYVKRLTVTLDVNRTRKFRKISSPVFILITMLGGDTVKYGSWDNLELDSPLLIKVFNLFEKAIYEIYLSLKEKGYL